MQQGLNGGSADVLGGIKFFDPRAQIFALVRRIYVPVENAEPDDNAEQEQAGRAQSDAEFTTHAISVAIPPAGRQLFYLGSTARFARKNFQNGARVLSSQTSRQRIRSRNSNRKCL